MLQLLRDIWFDLPELFRGIIVLLVVMTILAIGMAVVFTLVGVK